MTISVDRVLYDISILPWEKARKPRSNLRGSSLDMYVQTSVMIKGQNPFVVSVR